MPSKSWSTPGSEDSLASTCLPDQETDHSSLHLLPKGAAQRTRLERLRRDKGAWRHVGSRHRLLLDEEELAMRPTLPSGRCAQAHTVPRVQARPDAFPKRPSNIFCKILVPTQLQAIATQATFHETFRASGHLSRGSPQRFVRGYDWVLKCSSHSSRRIFSLPQILSLRAGS